MHCFASWWCHCQSSFGDACKAHGCPIKLAFKYELDVPQSTFDNALQWDIVVPVCIWSPFFNGCNLVVHSDKYINTKWTSWRMHQGFYHLLDATRACLFGWRQKPFLYVFWWNIGRQIHSWGIDSWSIGWMGRRGWIYMNIDSMGYKRCGHHQVRQSGKSCHASGGKLWPVTILSMGTNHIQTISINLHSSIW